MFEEKLLHASKKEEVSETKTDQSKEQLLNVLYKKHRTTFIGAISAIEEEFGELWGIGKEANDRTPEEEYWYQKWQKARTKILNNGNNQYRAVLNELQQYTVNWNAYKLNMRRLGNE